MFKTVMPLSSIIALRFFGLFLVLPVMSVYAMGLEGSTTVLVGVVIGGYALTQMIFQVPFGIMSDKLGRKGTIILGLLLFAIGSVICAVSTDILTLLLGRLLQGAGAIGAVVSAMISDVVKEEQRSKAMAIMGGSIAASFALAMIAGPLLGASFGIEILFWITGFIAMASIVILVTKVPNPPKITHTYHEKTKMAEILLNPNLVRMNITNFLQKGLMTFAFMIIPMILLKEFGWELKELWKVYLPAMVFGVLAMGPAAVFAEKRGKFKEVLMAGIVFFALSYYIIGNNGGSDTMFIVGVVLFFIGFNMHEPIMQSLASKFAKVHQRGMVLGIFNAFGYLGTFLGGLIGGIYFDSVPLESIALVIVVISLLWIGLIASMPNPSKKRLAYLSLDTYNRETLEVLDDENSIDEWYINDTENIVIVKYDGDVIDEDTIKGKLATI
ncbi:MAG: MFS transporter [Campylobacterota bacterium]|nr:MFS transporter [Campylobacterota bacterium]